MKGPYVPLSVSYRESDKMLGCEPLAELLFVRGLAFAKEKFSEGFISNRQVDILTQGLDVYHIASELLWQQLVATGLWHQVDGGFHIDGWADWNELDASRAGTLGNHVRWHVARGIVDSACAHCLSVTPTDRPESGGTSPPIAISTDQFNKTPSSPTAKVNVNGCAADFAAWWSSYPRKVAKQEAERAYEKARRNTPAEPITEGLARWNRQWDHEARPIDKIPHAATWLNNARWQDELIDTTADDDWMKGR